MDIILSCLAGAFSPLQISCFTDFAFNLQQLAKFVAYKNDNYSSIYFTFFWNTTVVVNSKNKQYLICQDC